ncbi:MAG: protein kinase [Alistipes sp.]|nr:protein kinase [Alistipes sp.]
MTLPVDTLLQGGKYRIVRFISSGGFGCTYEAIHVNMEERVAIKEFFVKDFCNRDETTAHITVGTVGKRALVDKLRRKFADEARALYKLKHPGIVRVSDVFEENGTAYYVMDYVDGLSLGEIVKRDGAMPEVRAVRYIRQVAEALRYVHDHNRLHLDIKPGNIMVDSDDNAILIDFGASKQYDEEAGENTSTLMGKTPGYAPLEQMGNNVMKFMPATDIYALGATLYKLLTGVTPLSANVLASGEELDPLPETISEPTRRAISAAMQIRKNDRPQTIDAFLLLLDAAPSGAAASAAASDETVFDDDATVVTASQQAPHKSTPQPAPQAAAQSYKSVLQPEPKRSFFGRHKWLTATACIAVFAVIGFVMVRSMNGDGAKKRAYDEIVVAGSDEQRNGASIEESSCCESAADEECYGACEESPCCESVVETPQPEPTVVSSPVAASSESDQVSRTPPPPLETAAESRLAGEATAAEYAKRRLQEEAAKSTTGTIAGHDWVDLGLSVKWATCNVGASSPSAYGNYYAWGETAPKAEYTEGSSAAYDKNLGDISGNASYDAARANWGGSWRMPSQAEMQELVNKCTWTWTTQGGHNGYMVTSRTNGNSIFLPAAGWRTGSSLSDAEDYGIYWCSSPYKNNTQDAYYIYFDSGSHIVHESYRSIGQSVRPVSR